MNKVIIFMEGGVIQHIASDVEVDVTIVDRDVEGCDEEEVRLVTGEEAYVYGGSYIEVNPKFVEKTLQEIKDQGTEE